jgi:colanic acid/amylovoran biosynthesis glycosyltransferase
VTRGGGLSLWPPLYRRLFRSADSLCTTSHYLADRLAALGAPTAKQTVIHVGIDTSAFSYANPAERFDGRVVRLLHVGRLTAKKSPLKLIRAVCEAQRLCSDRRLELTIAGDGELAEQSRALARELRVTDQIRFEGRVGRDRVRALLATHHLYTQYCETTPSGETEGLGVSFIEASASGLPIAGTRHNGIPEVVLDGVTGLLSDEGDVAGMARNIAALAMDAAAWQRLGRAGRRHVEATFALERQADALLAHCSAVAGNRR